MAKVEEKKAKVELMLDEIQTADNACPWCNFSNKDEEKAPLHDKVTDKYTVRNVGQAWQCDSCGKMWPKANLNKTWSIELERGPQWVRAMKMRGLAEGTA